MNEEEEDLVTKSVLSAVSDIKKSIFVLLFFIYGGHNCTCKSQNSHRTPSIPEKGKRNVKTILQQLTGRWKNIVHKYKDGLFCT